MPEPEPFSIFSGEGMDQTVRIILTDPRMVPSCLYLALEWFWPEGILVRREWDLDRLVCVLVDSCLLSLEIS